MSDFADKPFPRGALTAAGGLVLFTLALVSMPSLGVVDPPRTAGALRAEAAVAPVAHRDLRFFDRSDGALVVEDISGSTQVLAPGENHGFIRGVLRGLARERKRSGIGQSPAFRLTLWANGRLSLTDSATGRTIELDSFGGDNRKAFAALLHPLPSGERGDSRNAGAGRGNI